MRQGSPSNVRTIVSPTGSQPGSKSLFQNILDVSPYTSRFYPYPSFPAFHKLLRMSILEEQRKEVGSRHSPKFECKSLLQKILPISPYPSRFWRDLARSSPSKSLRMNILGIRREKMSRIAHTKQSGFRFTPRTVRVKGVPFVVELFQTCRRRVVPADSLGTRHREELAQRVVRLGGACGREQLDLLWAAELQKLAPMCL